MILITDTAFTLHSSSCRLSAIAVPVAVAGADSIQYDLHHSNTKTCTMIKLRFPTTARCILAKSAGIALTLLMGIFSSAAEANVTWNWLTTDGTDIATGTLITEGLVEDALVGGNTFPLLSIESVSLNGTLITEFDSAGPGPPFNDPAFGVLESQGAGVGDFFAGDTGLFGFDSSFANTVSIGEAFVGNSRAGFDANSANHYSFVPTVTTFAVQLAVPEPPACSLFFVVMLALSRLSLRRR